MHIPSSCIKPIKRLSIFLFISTLTFAFFSLHKWVQATAVSTCSPITSSIIKSSAQSDLTGSQSIKFTASFSSPIDASTFEKSQITLSGTAITKEVSGITEVSPNNGTTFEISVTAASGTVEASINSGILTSAAPAPVAITADQSGNTYNVNSNPNSDAKIAKNGAVAAGLCKSSTGELETNRALPSSATNNVSSLADNLLQNPGTPDLATSSDTGSSNTDNITNDTIPTFDISCDSGNDITLIKDGIDLDTKPCPASNTVSFVIITPLVDGLYKFKAKQSNIVDFSSELDLTIDTVVPNAPGLNFQINRENQLNVFGQCEIMNNLVITISPTNEVINSNCDTNSQYFISSITIPEGPFSVSVVELDIAGNSSTSTLQNGVKISPTLDTDGDLVPDYIESIEQSDSTNNLNFEDTDKDYVPDFVEQLDGTNRDDKNSFLDTDSGGVPDYVETKIYPTYQLSVTDINNRSDDSRDSDNDGLTDYQDILVGSSPRDADFDNDGIDDGIEAKGPNNGDFNNDGILDFRQAKAQITKGLNNDFIAIDYATTNTCRIAQYTLNVTPEATLSRSDSDYLYPKGLVNFKSNCIDSEGIQGVTIYFSNQADSPNLKVRKFKNGVYSDIPGVVKTQVTLDGLPTLKVSYTIIDGGELDEDGVVNGEISDPVGLALLDTPPPIFISPAPVPPTPPTPQVTVAPSNIVSVLPTLVPVLIRTGGAD
jgi:hypothetical protein